MPGTRGSTRSRTSSGTYRRRADESCCRVTNRGPSVIGSSARWVLRSPGLAALVTTLVAVALAWPMIATSAGMNQDWPNHLWYLWQQSLNIKRDGVPSLFVTQGARMFY